MTTYKAVKLSRAAFCNSSGVLVGPAEVVSDASPSESMM
eukprot:CAMPEP_0197063966 /NCGR_PEP_ID=MMETSP1384-20130603/155890_1 /TAXON_ID=29189 /ORGANISM="Ammonia sp." /LENGTH=38 /DNA_ID= /DNA_START= /DNA_END= /DNA_ORIENTATION=